MNRCFPCFFSNCEKSQKLSELDSQQSKNDQLKTMINLREKLESLKKYDASGTATFTKFKDVPLPVGSALTIPKIVLNTSDKIQVQSSSSSGLLDVSLELLTDIS